MCGIDQVDHIVVAADHSVKGDNVRNGDLGCNLDEVTVDKLYFFGDSSPVSFVFRSLNVSAGCINVDGIFNPSRNQLMLDCPNSAANVDYRERPARSQFAGERWRIDQNAGVRFRRGTKTQEADPRLCKRLQRSKSWSDRRAEQSFDPAAAERSDLILADAVNALVHTVDPETQQPAILAARRQQHVPWA